MIKFFLATIIFLGSSMLNTADARSARDIVGVLVTSWRAQTPEELKGRVARLENQLKKFNCKDKPDRCSFIRLSISTMNDIIKQKGG